MIRAICAVLQKSNHRTTEATAPQSEIERDLATFGHACAGERGEARCRVAGGLISAKKLRHRGPKRDHARMRMHGLGGFAVGIIGGEAACRLGETRASQPATPIRESHQT